MEAQKQAQNLTSAINPLLDRIPEFPNPVTLSDAHIRDSIVINNCRPDAGCRHTAWNSIQQPVQSLRLTCSRPIFAAKKLTGMTVQEDRLGIFINHMHPTRWAHSHQTQQWQGLPSGNKNVFIGAWAPARLSHRCFLVSIDPIQGEQPQQRLMQFPPSGMVLEEVESSFNKLDTMLVPGPQISQILLHQRILPQKEQSYLTILNGGIHNCQETHFCSSEEDAKWTSHWKFSKRHSRASARREPLIVVEPHRTNPIYTASLLQLDNSHLDDDTSREPGNSTLVECGPDAEDPFWPPDEPPIVSAILFPLQRAAVDRKGNSKCSKGTFCKGDKYPRHSKKLLDYISGEQCHKCVVAGASFRFLPVITHGIVIPSLNEILRFWTRTRCFHYQCGTPEVAMIQCLGLEQHPAAYAEPQTYL
ncbi:hypothetical protein Pelo_7529 [Pelomyxa schiedti]|nr:hypothetical protein Pelo_7529 [Pelomyxa schiedti]